MLKVSPELSRKIQQRIDALAPMGPGAWPVRVCREELNALPLHADRVYLWALRPDGEVLCMDHEASGHPAEPERDPATLRTALAHGARLYPELAELAPATHGLDGSGPGEPHDPAPTPLPVDGWLERIDRGDQLTITREREWLYAGRLAGQYVCRVGDEHWSAPTAPELRRELADRLRGWASGPPHSIAWSANPSGAPDPWDSAEVTLFFEWQTPMGGYEAEYERQPDGTVRVTETMLNDWDPAGWIPPTVTGRVLSDADARNEFVSEMRRPAHASPFPEIRPRGRGA